MRTYLYLLAWVAGSEGACEEDTKVNDLDDLMPQFLAHNQACGGSQGGD